MEFAPFSPVSSVSLGRSKEKGEIGRPGRSVSPSLPQSSGGPRAPIGRKEGEGGGEVWWDLNDSEARKEERGRIRSSVSSIQLLGSSKCPEVWNKSVVSATFP